MPLLPPPLRPRALRLAFALSGLLAGAAVPAATLTVVHTGDSGAGSLRQAITDANATSDADTIAFAMPGAGPFTITPATRLPNLRGVLTIDGFTQPGSHANTLAPDQGGLDAVPMIQVTGPGNGFGFVLEGGSAPASVTLRGLVINGFAPHIGGGAAGARLTIHGCYIGTTADGTAAVPSASMACITTAGTLQLGGTLPAQRNLLANCGNGAVVAGNGEAVIEGNLIGTDAGAGRALPGSIAGNGAGIIVNAGSGSPRLRIGGASVAARNLISGNHGSGGIALFGTLGFAAYAQFEILGNYIGTDWTGTRAIPNGYPDTPRFSGGIVLWRVAQDDSPAPIGGDGPGQANLIAYNHGAGILSREGRIGESFDNRGNRIHHNRGIGRTNVDLAPAGPTPNDPADADAGANGGQNWPQIDAAVVAGGQLQVTYRVDSSPQASAYPLRVDFYENVQGGNGALLGRDSYPAGAAQQPRTIVLALPPGARAVPLVAVATDARGYSSEFSPAFGVLFEDDFE